MITSIRLVDFKNFADETLRIGPFTIIVGANASGKSNIRDAFRFLHGIGRRYTLAEIIGGHSETGWNPIRGAGNEVARAGSQQFSVEVETRDDDPSNPTIMHYDISVECAIQDGGGFKIVSEALRANSQLIYKGSLKTDKSKDLERAKAVLEIDVPVYGEQMQDWRYDRPILGQFDPQFSEELNSVEQYEASIALYSAMNHSLALAIDFLSIKFLELSPHEMRKPTFPDNSILGARGENLPSVLKTIWSDINRRDVLIPWLQELTPMDVKRLDFPSDPSGRVHLYLHEGNGREISAVQCF